MTQSTETPQLPEGLTLEDVESVMFLDKAIPEFRKRLNGLMITEAKKVIAALTEYPLEQSIPVIKDKKTAELYQLGKMIFDQKVKVLSMNLMKQVDKLTNKEEKKEENNNG